MQTDNMPTFIDDKNMMDSYFELQEKFSEKYGKNTIVFMQNGSFHEAYQTNDGLYGYELNKLSDIMNIVVTKKDKSAPSIGKKNPYMLGFPTVATQKFIKILVENMFTVVLIDQVTPAPKPKRQITGIYSPGTYVEEITNPDSNYLMSIYIEEVEQNSYICGISMIDLGLGKTYVFECFSEMSDELVALDDIAKIINCYPAREFILTLSNLKSMNKKKISCYLELSNKLCHVQEINTIDNKQLKNEYMLMPKISYQNNMLKTTYGLNGGYATGEQSNMIETLGLENMTNSRFSLMILLKYIKDHNQSLLKNLKIPEIIEKTKNLFLGNNAIYQLNIFNNDSSNASNIFYSNTQYRCLFDVINKTSTAMGRRFLKANLINPLINVELINNRYKLIEYWSSENKLKELEKILNTIPDIERYIRKISTAQIHPLDLYNCIIGMKSCYDLIVNLDCPDELFFAFNFDEHQNKFDEFINKIDNDVDYKELPKYLINDITGNIFKQGMNGDVDVLITEIASNHNYLSDLTHTINKLLNSLIPKKKTKDNDSDDELIHMESSDKEGHYLVLTKRRSELLQEYLNANKCIQVNSAKTLTQQNIEFKYLNKGNTCKIFINDFKQQSQNISDLTEKLRILIKDKYVNWLNDVFCVYGKMFDWIVSIVSIIDFCKSGAKCAIQNKYTKPIISNKYKSVSYLSTKNMRHPICEKLLIDTEYKPISIELIPEKNGILLFGLNSVGKSTLQKSIGINIILAQIGYYTASSSFEYYPYTSLMTRISANDNLFKGLSSFSLEIAELRAILKRSNNNSLIIADEVCKGTEHKSSIIIVMTMLEILSKTGCSFITATHLHDLIKIPRLKLLKNICLYHLHVEYNEKTNVLLYDRELREGPGDNFYGLNVAKHLINDSDFLTISNEIKQEVIGNDIIKTSKYNSKLFVTECQICGKKCSNKYEIPLETHHIVFQKNSDKDGYLTNEQKQHIHKNHKSNLCVLCYACHDKIDTKEIIIYGYSETINGTILNYTTIDQEIEMLSELQKNL